jgi:hypothetical protein
VLPNLQLAWVFTGITGLAALALAGLIAYAREVEGRRLHSRQRVDHVPTFDDDGPGLLSRPAQSGLPGAWDDEDYGGEFPPEPRIATGG